MATAQAHSGVTDTTATIAVSGLAAPLKVLHLSDSHISLSSDNEPHSSRMHRAFYSDGAGRPHRTTGETQLPRDRFIQQVEEATANGTELLIHTGDFLNVRCLCSPIAPALETPPALLDFYNNRERQRFYNNRERQRWASASASPEAGL